ncbi:MAG: signal peptide peptidase SppA [Candidatus Diapherotrites archaeon]
MIKKKTQGMKFILIFVLIALIVLFAVSFIVFALVGSVSFNSVALIPIKGEISNFGSAGFTAEELAEEIHSACGNSSISAVVLDIDSGGGSVVATKQIVYEIRDCEKPVVSYIGEIGASGAYYVASATDFIYADSDSFVGSIGVISFIPNVEGLMEKIGVEMQVLTAGEFKDMGSPFRELTEEEKVLFEELLQEVYFQFRSDVLEFREGKLTEMNLAQVDDGRIVSGRTALKLNLIDEIGRKKDAINKAAELAGISSDPNVIKIEKEEFSLSDIFLKAGLSFGKGFVNSFASDNVKVNA